MNRQLLGVVLCGGRSCRMGRDKAILPHPGGGTWMQHATDRLVPICASVIVSGTSTARHTLETVQDRVPFRGPAGGIASALHYAARHSFDACLITPIDMPSLETADLRRLVQRWTASTPGRAHPTIARSDRIEPLVGIYPVSLGQSMTTLAESADRSLSRWLESRSHVTVTLSKESCRNVNTLEDLSHGS